MGPGGKNMYESVGLGFSPALLFTFVYRGVVYMNPVNPLPLFEKIEVIHALRCHRILTVLLKRSEVTFFFFPEPCGRCDHSSPFRDGICNPAV